MHIHSSHRRVPIAIALSALLLASGAWAAGTVPGGNAAGAAGSGPALVAPSTVQPANAANTVAAQVQPTQPSTLPPMSGNGLPPMSGNGVPPISGNGNGLPPVSGNGIAGGATGAIAGQTPLTPSTLPARTETATSAFRTLDARGTGYVTRADTDRLPGFIGFDTADTDRDGRLTQEEFNNAWKFYGSQ